VRFDLGFVSGFDRLELGLADFELQRKWP